MTITAINGSPKAGESNSLEIISILKSMMDPTTTWHVVSSRREAKSWSVDEKIIDKSLISAEVLLIVFPLYVDGLPASLMRYLELYAKARLKLETAPTNQRVFAIANCGFYEGEQNRNALEIIGHFCAASGLEWCGGLGIGTGEMILGIKNVPPEAGIRKPIFDGIRKIAHTLETLNGRLLEPLFTQHGFPKLLYKLAGEAGWRSSLRKNGAAKRNIHARPLLKGPAG